MKSLTVIVPFFNEERTLFQLVHQLSEMPDNVINHLIFVDDGSTDQSFNLLSESLKETSLSYTLLRKDNGGKASAIREASRILQTSHAVILDADLELYPRDILKLWSVVLEDRSDIVFGFRNFLSHSAFTYRYARGNQFLSHLYGLLYNEVITDIMCGFKLLPSIILQEIPYRFKKFSIEVEIPLHLWLRRNRPYEVLVDYRPRSREEGKVIGIKDALRIIFLLIFFRIKMARKRLL